MELENIISDAVRSNDEETLYLWANIVASTDAEWGEEILQLARQADNNNWAYDRDKDNNL